ncbi:activating signal cointegrator 1 complex subunit 2 isoform X1 [Vanessa tameamea]|uniref:Activating signal cointegrator 1 complex subunit 2 isoform X1 n=1 Tax=Vanessa tameamea TaxID=334116 RepID=A0ABM4AQH5_VANTA
MSNSRVEFNNPENLPAENVTVSVRDSGVLQLIKAIDPYWVEKKDLILYERPPSGAELLLGAVDAWRSKMETYLDNLKWLLELEQNRFWSTILYHPMCMDMVISFIQEANPPYIASQDSKDVQKLYEEIRRLILVIFSRLITNKESKTQWMSKEYLADLIYDNFIFTIPVLWDLCLMYGADNSKHISHLMNAVFSIQPKYQNDVVQALIFVQEAFKYIILQVNKDYESDEPPNLPETFMGFGEIRRPSGNKPTDKVTFNVLRDLIIHMLDTAMTLRIFVEVYPKTAEIMMKSNFVLSIVQLYEYGIPQLYEKLIEVGDETSVTYTEVEGYIDLARAELIDTLKEILAVYKDAILNCEGNIASNVEAYLSVMMDALSERLLIKDYHACYQVHEDLELLKQAYPDIDTVKTDYILQAVYSDIDDPIPEVLNDNNKLLTNGNVEVVDNEPGPSRDNEIPDNVRDQSLICEVKDILPHLGDGFILKCLQHYGHNAERVINAILEDNLADSLRGLDTSLPIIPEDPVDRKYLETGIERLNVFDGDQFDIMTRDDVDLSKIHVGKKKEKYKDLKDMLNDKTEVKNRADIYSKYNLVCDEEAMYSDEYDDTYDSDGVSPAADATDDGRRPFVTPRALRTPAGPPQEESEESEEVEEETPSRSKMNFCVNPEELRARREANVQARRGRGGRPPPARNIDVIGKPKGHGQEKETLMNRDKKEKHKSSRGNHNRRQGAQWKRSQGMMPS